MRILILSQYYKPEPIPKVHELAEELQRRGHEVAVITGVPNYPAGELYEGHHHAIARKETIDGVPVVRTFEFPYHGRSAAGRIANYVSFMMSAPLGGFRSGPADVIYVWHPPLTVGVAAWMLALIKRAPFVYDVQDIWPESAILSGMFRDGILVRSMKVLEAFVYRRASRILAVTEKAKANVVGKGIDASRVQVMPNWVDASLYEPANDADVARLRQERGWDGRFVVMFAGNIGLVQGLDNVVAAAEKLREEPKFLFVLVGDGSDRSRIEQLVSDRDLGASVQFVERQPQAKMSLYLSAADALLVHLKKSDLADFVIPTKTLAYFGIGRPIVAATGGAAAELVEREGVGLAAAPDDPDALADVVRRVASLSREETSRIASRGRTLLREQYSRQQVISKYEEMLHEVAAAGGRTR